MSSISVVGDTSGSIRLSAPAVSGSSVLTLPVATDTLVGKATIDTLTNKTLTSPILTSPALGTPTSGVLTNCTGLPILTGVTGTLPVANGGTGVTTSTGTGANVLGTSPSISSPSISGAVMTTMASSVITSGTAVASTSGTSIDFTGIPSWVKRITILLHRVSTTGTAPLLYQLGTSSGIVSTGYVSSGSYQGAGQGGLQSTSGLLNGAGGATADTAVGLTTICNFGSNTWVSSSVSGDGNADYTKIGGGSITLSATLDRIRITTTTGTPTFDAGSINILYE